MSIKERYLISNETNIENLRTIALHHLDLLLNLKDANEFENYNVMLGPTYTSTKRWESICSGYSKERCIGYANCYGYDTVVAAGKMIVWPEDRWGETMDEE